jgi:hypothetical protein
MGTVTRLPSDSQIQMVEGPHELLQVKEWHEHVAQPFFRAQRQTLFDK